MQHEHVLKKLNFELLTHSLSPPRDQTEAFDLKSCLICFIYIVPHDINLTFRTPVLAGGRGSAAKIFPTMLLHL